MLPGTAVFRIGDPKGIIFRVESGRIRISEMSGSGTSELVEEIGSGTVFGLGFLDEHVYDAIAISKSVVSCWPKDAIGFLESLDPDVRQRRSIDTEREFIHRRRTLVDSAPKTPPGQLAGFLCVASRLNEAQGRDAELIDDTVDCGSVASFLRMDLATLRHALVELFDRGLIAYEAPSGLRLIDLEALQSLAGNEVRHRLPPVLAKGGDANA
ncbi:MAG: hypothetical protein APF80_15820 [Alphaproteobacteria bacterium BRH_c36]|nr:MAG: hypothetical protein APF80_15820 [Alphaproteobacteria bacterium BRH_c36]